MPLLHGRPSSYGEFLPAYFNSAASKVSS
uniref:Uncharacterized protein n=1 Tax=Arundo donax TaxID=35708 RepID=A0A0A9I331_ARUDO